MHISQPGGVSTHLYVGLFQINLTAACSLCVSFIDRLDDVELAGVCSGSGSLCGFVWRFAPNAHAQCTVEPDGPAGVS